jgi:hypothetical protein
MTDDRCMTCGAELPSLAGLALTLADDARRAGAAYQALICMRLALPDQVPTTLRDLAARWEALAPALRCHAGLCRRPAQEATP